MNITYFESVVDRTNLLLIESWMLPGDPSCIAGGSGPDADPNLPCNQDGINDDEDGTFGDDMMTLADSLFDATNFIRY